MKVMKAQLRRKVRKGLKRERFFISYPLGKTLKGINDVVKFGIFW